MYRHHIELRVHLYVPKEETFTVPLKCIGVTWTIHTNLDVLQEKRIGDCWNLDENRSVSDSKKGRFTKFTLSKEKPPKGIRGPGKRLTKIQATTRPENVWPEVWTKIGKAAQKREKQEWADEQPQLDNARRLRVIYLSIWKMVNVKKPSKPKEKVGSSNGGGNSGQGMEEARNDSSLPSG